MAITRTRPTGGKVKRRDIVTAIVDVNDINAISVLTEMEATTSLALECVLRDYDRPASEATETDPGRYCDGDSIPTPGTVTREAFELRGVWRPSLDEDAPENKAYASLKAAYGQQRVIVNRPDYDKDLPVAADQFYDAQRGIVGKLRSTRSGGASDSNSEWEFAVTFYPSEEPAEHKQFVA